MRFAILVSTCLVAAASSASTVYMGIYLQNTKIGYVTSSSRQEGIGSAVLERNESKTLIESKLLGSNMKMSIDATTWSVGIGKPKRMEIRTESGGKTQTLTADFKEDQVAITVLNNGNLTKKSLPVPPNSMIVDDPTFVASEFRGKKQGVAQSFYLLDPTTVSLIKASAVYTGRKTINFRGVDFVADEIVVTDPRVAMKCYVTGNGDLIKVTSGLGMEMVSETESEAKNFDKVNATSIDIADKLAVKSNIPIERPMQTIELSATLDGYDLSSVGSDMHQKISKKGPNSWSIWVRPTAPNASASKNIGDINRTIFAPWIGNDQHIPASAKGMKELAKGILAGEKNLVKAASLIRAYVYKTLRPNAGMGILRDAREVLKTGEGVCRDYAILTATLMRAAGIPTKLVTGMVYYQDRFYFHAWVEAWDGKRWLGYDSTLDQNRLSATHIKLAQGSLADAFLMPVISGAKIVVKQVRY